MMRLCFRSIFIGVSSLHLVELASAVLRRGSAASTRLPLSWVSSRVRSPQSPEQDSVSYTAGSRWLPAAYIAAHMPIPGSQFIPPPPFPS